MTYQYYEDRLKALIQYVSIIYEVPIGAGGLGGAEGAITLVIKTSGEQVKKAIDYAEQSKGARLPQLRLSNCFNCQPMPCKFPVGDKHWSQV